MTDHMRDYDDYTIEEKLISSVWVHDKALTGKSMDEIRADFEQRFAKKAPKHDQLIGWERSAFSTGSVLEMTSPMMSHMGNTREQQQHHNRMHSSGQGMDGSVSSRSSGGAQHHHQQQQHHNHQHHHNQRDHGDHHGDHHGDGQHRGGGGKPAASSYHPSLYKTELCRQYYEYGYCDYGERCLFAHGKYELKRIPNYKTKLCAQYHSSGYCSFGSRCAFIHKKHEAREPDVPKARTSHSIRPNRRTEMTRKK